MSPSPEPRVRRPFAALLLLAALAFQTSGCGTLIFPQRRGQAREGKLDPNVLLLDGLLVVFFIVPAVIAYTVDYCTGTLWLPPGKEDGEGPFWGESELFDKSNYGSGS